MKSVVLLLGVMLVVALIGCNQPVEVKDNSTPKTVSSLTPADIQKIREYAEVIARLEMDRFNDKETEYKDEVSFWPALGHPFRPESGVFSRVYRVFESFEVTDIQLSENLLKPIQVSVVYTARVFTTEAIHSDYDDAEEQALALTEFSELRTETELVNYTLDFEGNMVGEAPEVPIRASFWDKGSLVPPDMSSS